MTRVKALLRRTRTRVWCAISLIGIGRFAKPHKVGVIGELPECQCREHAKKYPRKDATTCQTQQTKHNVLDSKVAHSHRGGTHHGQRK